jgi:hypothetical protein
LPQRRKASINIAIFVAVLISGHKKTKQEIDTLYQSPVSALAKGTYFDTMNHFRVRVIHFQK